MDMVAQLISKDERFRRIPPKPRTELAWRMLRKELAAENALPSFEEWQKTTAQTSLF